LINATVGVLKDFVVSDVGNLRHLGSVLLLFFRRDSLSFDIFIDCRLRLTTQGAVFVARALIRIRQQL
jgi:hypothetical protein